ncbi:unnamed protein product [Periconia digitata]|uniref:Uncharacterized protein n=1 Tax=Periconia digitata TaxID=1303443 RepID=A0A9W4U559_9PLEO|nr:unnamed protein product [Periconia digitata]
MLLLVSTGTHAHPLPPASQQYTCCCSTRSPWSTDTLHHTRPHNHSLSFCLSFDLRILPPSFIHPFIQVHSYLGTHVPSLTNPAKCVSFAPHHLLLEAGIAPQDPFSSFSPAQPRAMAYQQRQYDDYSQPQPRQQRPPQQQHQYYNQGPPQGRQPAGYNQQQQQYDDYGYDQAQYDQWDDGYYDQQQGGWERGQQGGYGDMPAQRQPAQRRAPPPQNGYPQEQQQYDDHYQQPHQQQQRRDPRGPPMGRGRMPPPQQQGRGGLRAPEKERAMMQPKSPMNLPQDNAFPTFPSTKSTPRTKAGSIDEAMAFMDLGPDTESRAPAQGRPMGPPGGRGRGGPRGPPPMGRGDQQDMSRHDSGHYEGSGRGQRLPPQRMGSNAGMPAPHQHFGAHTQRSQTMPQTMPGAGGQRGYDTQQQWAESGPAAGYHGPRSPTGVVPPRPSTAGGNRPNAQNQRFEQRPPVPQMPPAQQQYNQHPQDDAGALDNVYDDYYGNDRRSQGSIDMPNFDAIQESSSKHRRGDSIDGHLVPSGDKPPSSEYDVGGAQGNFYQQASRSRSQPDLNAQYSQGNGVYEMADNAPPMPPLNGLPPGPRGRGPPPRGMTADPTMRRGPPQGYGGGGGYDAGFGRHPGLAQRGYSDETTYSEPPNAMRTGSPMVQGNPIARPGTAAPAPGRMLSDPMGRRPGTTNPDALPSHPTPVRAGLMQQQGQPPMQQGGRPPPVRQYNTDPPPNQYGNQQAPAAPAPRRLSEPHPVTHDEINRLRNSYKNNPSDNKTGLLLAKKLVEAASVLADENGTADTRTRNKNREKFINEAYKIVKKLVSNGAPDAMFYLADCYGQGLLGLQTDTKQAFTLYQSAAKLGHAASAYRTAVCCEMGHEEGGGTKQDPLKAVQWYKRAAALGDTPAMYKVGMILLKGLLGQQRNLGEAINMLKRAADRADEENPHSLHELALIYESQTGNERIIRDEPYAFQLFNQAAALGYKFSQFRLGQAYEYGLLGCPIDPRASIAWYTKAAAQEEHQSELALSGWYLTGTSGILEQSDTEAYLWARKAACAEPPLPKALFAMGYFTEVGIGCPRSLDEAKRWYGRAAAYKFPKAQERLEELKKGGAKVQMKRERLSRSNQKQQEENCTVM